MEIKKMGRPKIQASQKKRLQYSVWVNEEEKKEIDGLIKSSNLSSSKFFIEQVLNRPYQRPKKKDIPPEVAKQITNLEKLSGLLSLIILKTSSKDFISQNWEESSKNVKWITQIILLKIFEEFDLPSFNKRLTKIFENTTLLSNAFKYFKTEDKKEFLHIINALLSDSQELLLSYTRRFQTLQTIAYVNIWHEDFDIHSEIEKLKNKIQNDR